jgi:hypothetical protein
MNMSLESFPVGLEIRCLLPELPPHPEAAIRHTIAVSDQGWSVPPHAMLANGEFLRMSLGGMSMFDPEEGAMRA